MKKQVSLADQVSRYVRHARLFGDARSVFETASRDDGLSASALGHLAARLRDTKPILENARFRTGEGRNERWVPWPRFQLTVGERDRLARRLLADGVGHKTVGVYLGATVGWVRRLAAVIKADAEGGRLLAEHGPVDLLDSSTPEAVRDAWKAILSGGSSSAESGPRQPINAGDSTADPVVGSRFGRLVVQSFGRNERGRRVARVRCDCDVEKEVEVAHLGKTKSCGCLRREQIEAMRAGGSRKRT